VNPVSLSLRAFVTGLTMGFVGPLIVIGMPHALATRVAHRSATSVVGLASVPAYAIQPFVERPEWASCRV
jgi:hypothetical protein